jgi:hypothetical protein
LLLDGGAIEAPFTPIRPIGHNALAARFNLDAATRRTLILKLFSGAHRNKVDKINPPRVLFAIGKKIFS